MNPKISVIVPVYNAEKYLPRCIDSVLTQIFTDFELLLIDDGSIDESGKICNEYADNDKRIRVFHKENGGVSSARNVGLDKAIGEWITFLDSDDSLFADFFSSFAGLLDSNVDFVTSSFVNESNGLSIPLKQMEGEDALSLLYLSDAYRYMQPWAKFYRKNIILQNKLRFDTKINIGEDKLFILNYLLFVRKSIVSNQALYLYNDGIGLSLKHYDREQELYLAEKTHKAIDVLVEKFSPSVSTLELIKSNEHAELDRILFTVKSTSNDILLLKKSYFLYKNSIGVICSHFSNSKKYMYYRLFELKKYRKLLFFLKIRGIINSLKKIIKQI